MRTIEIQYDQAFLDAAETVQAYVKYVLETEKTTAVLLTRVCPQTSLLEEDYVLSLNGEPCPLDLEFPIRIRGVWYEKETDQTPKYIVADPEDGRDSLRGPLSRAVRTGAICGRAGYRQYTARL